MVMKKVVLDPEEQGQGAQGEESNQPAPAAKPRREPRAKRRDAAETAPTPASPLDALAAETIAPAQSRPATPVSGSPAAPACSGTLTGVGPEAPVVSPPAAPAALKIVDVRFRTSPPIEAFLVSKPGDTACTVALPLRYLEVGVPPVTSFSTTVERKVLSGSFSSTHQLRVDSDSNTLFVEVGVTNLTFDEGFLLPSDSHELLVRFPDGFETAAVWVESDPVLKLAFPLAWRLKERAEVQIRGRDVINSRISQFSLRMVDGVPELLITFRPLSAFCHKCKSELRDGGVCPTCLPPPVSAPTPTSVVAGFQPIVPAAPPSPSPVVGWSGQAPPVATPPPPLPQQPPPPAGQVTSIQGDQPADPAQRRYCAHCGYEFTFKNERVCPRCQTVRGESKPPQQQPVPAASASTAVVPAAHAAYAPPGTLMVVSIGKNFCEQCGHTRQHGAGLKCCEQCGHPFPN